MKEYGGAVARPFGLYDLDLSYEWSGLFKNPPRTLNYLVGRNIRQVNLPIFPLADSIDVTNEVIRLTDPAAGGVLYTGWRRRIAATGEVILAGIYGTCELPGHDGRFVRGFYPLTNGSVSVVFRPRNEPDGSFTLVSEGRRFGEAGYYRTNQTDPDMLHVKCVPVREVVRVFVGFVGTLRARHTFAFGEVRFLTLRYKITPRIL